MSDFETEFDLTLNLPQRELDNVAQQIDDTVGVTEVGVTDGGTMSAQAAGGGGRARRRARRSFRMEQTRTDRLEESVTYLEEIEDHLAQGVGGGGGGVVDDMLGAVVETGGDAAVEGSSMLADLGIETLGTSIGSTVGSAVSSAISDSSVSVSKPSWIPLTVEQPEPIDVEEPPQAGFKSEPGPVGFKDLPGPVGFEELPGPVGFEELPGPIAIEEVDPLPVEDVEPIDVEISVNTSGGGGVSTPPPSTQKTGASDGGTQSMLDLMYKGTGAGGVFGAIAGASTYAAQVYDSDTDAGPIVDGDEKGLWSMFGSGSGETTTQTGGSSGTSSGSGGGATTVNVEVSSNNDVTVEPQAADIADEVVSELESSLRDTIDDVRNRVSDAEADIDRLERALRRSG